MTAPQKQEVAATVAATEEKKRVSRRTGRIGLVLVMAFSVAILWLVYSPAFPGEYLGDAGNTKVTVTDSGTGVHVEISGAASGSPKVSAYEAQQSWYTLRFGTDLDQQAMVYQPGGHYELVTGCRSMVLIRQNWIARHAVSHPWGVALGVMAFMVVYIFVALREKAKAEPEVIHPMWLAYFGALFGSALILVAAGEEGMFGWNGEPRTRVAEVILDAVRFLLDISSEFSVLLGLLVFVVLTQWCAYLFAGLNGAARRPRFIALAWKWVALLIAKALIGASAIVFSIEIVGGHFYWVNTEPHTFAASFLTSAMLLFLGICVFSMVPMRSGNGRTAGKFVRRVHRCMLRRMRKKPDDVIARMQKRAARRRAWPYPDGWNPFSASRQRCCCGSACAGPCRADRVVICRVREPDADDRDSA